MTMEVEKKTEKLENNKATVEFTEKFQIIELLEKVYKRKDYCSLKWCIRVC